MADPLRPLSTAATGGAPADVESLLRRAEQAARGGEAGEAVRLWREVVRLSPSDPRALNALGNRALAAGDAPGARVLFERAVIADPAGVPLWLNLSVAALGCGDTGAALASLDRALAIDPYLFPALLQKVRLLVEAGRDDAAAQVGRGLLTAYPVRPEMPAEMVRARAEVQEIVDAANARREESIASELARVYAAHDEGSVRRARRYVDHLLGRTQVFAQQPTQGHFPFLPAIEYFDEALFPWFAALEAGTDLIRRELAARWRDGDDAPEPYVAFPPGAPVNQWAELNHSPRWGSYFLWRDGARQEANIARCPETAALMATLPLFDLAGKGPTVMFSILDANTRIPPHTGSTNIRTTVHLPLIVPGTCGFRVGGETREWVEGRAWGFDDTIEHEAWNESGRPRAILIVDCWNPLLSDAEREVIRASGG